MADDGEKKPAKLAHYRRNASRKTRKQLMIMERQLLVLELHVAGSSFTQISRHLESKGFKGCSRSNVGNDLDAALVDANEGNISKKKHLVQLELRRLDALTLAGWPRTVKKGEPEDIHAQLAIMTRRARYLNLEKPDRIEHTGVDGGPIETTMTHDLSKLSDADLVALKMIQSKLNETENAA